MTTFSSFLDLDSVVAPIEMDLGKVSARGREDDIHSSLAPFFTLPAHKVRYPSSVIQALEQLYAEYNNAFIPLVAKNREWPTDYKHCVVAWTPVNFCVQIDMVGLPEKFLFIASSMSSEEVREILRHRVFEIENSVAMYQFLERIFGNESRFKVGWRAVLDGIRKRFGRPIALLAVTDQKYRAMSESEFGVMDGSAVPDDVVFELSGFDKFFSPAEFRKHVEENGGECRYLLYVRSSDPVAKLKNPNVVVEHPLLSDANLRRIIKSNSLTFNIDAPEMRFERRINDTKEYMPTLGMAIKVSALEEVFSQEFLAHLSSKSAHKPFQGKRVALRLAEYLTARGINLESVERGDVHLRAKPAKCTYGCYGHVSGAITDKEFRAGLRNGLRQRGAYVIQPELRVPRIMNTCDGTGFTFIDRNFFGIVKGSPVFLGGFRNLIPRETVEAQNGRIHGNKAAVWAEILPA